MRAYFSFLSGLTLHLVKKPFRNSSKFSRLFLKRIPRPSILFYSINYYQMFLSLRLFQRFIEDVCVALRLISDIINNLYLSFVSNNIITKYIQTPRFHVTINSIFMFPIKYPIKIIIPIWHCNCAFSSELIMYLTFKQMFYSDSSNLLKRWLYTHVYELRCFIELNVEVEKIYWFRVEVRVENCRSKL